MSTKNRKIWAAGVLLILTVAAAIGFLFRLSQPDQEQRSVYLNCTESDRGGWVFFTEAGPVEPVFGLVVISTVFRRRGPALSRRSA